MTKGLKHLEELKNLETLDVRKTKVSEQGLDNLKQALPHLEVESDFKK